ncbi:MAG: YafY family transcriptional regulator [Candidatus Eremiobacteraeota bacterium]|nr:YafY family transcriptional regulator [Candidatus Eremiobacteraeota bacterium]MBV8435074.1 YafY family transcriptional regulator [Candidatus Eremiobacteraeota bacterium]MBV8721536.1 YafY family transcriptional regulator [Candidatus Eremiobacteraeota bacterium]
MKADRLISLLLLLQSRGQCTAPVLAELLEVSERTIYRDVDALSAAGVPVYCERGSTGGILLSDGYRQTLTHFSEDEIRALFASGASPLADLGFDGGLDRALEKLHGGLADVHRRAAEKSRSRIHLDGRRWNQAEPPRALLTLLRRAVWDDRRVEMRYEDRNRNASTRVVEPLGLVAKAGIWYLVARSENELRSFRVERIAGASELEEHFSRPSDFDLERYWAESSARFAETSRSENLVVTFAVEPSAIERLSAYWPVELIERRDGEAIVRVTLPGEEMAIYQTIAWADVARVLEPAALRDRAIARARQFVERNA